MLLLISAQATMENDLLKSDFKKIIQISSRNSNPAKFFENVELENEETFFDWLENEKATLNGKRNLERKS